MADINKVYLSGLGAIGGVFASLLYRYNPGCISVIADKERIARYVEKGIFVNGIAYPFNYISPEHAEAPADLILIAVKQHQLLQALKDIKNFVGPKTIIMPLLNGIVSEEITGNVFGMDKVLYAFCVGTDATREGTVITFSNTGRIVFGEKNNCSISPKVKAVRELFDKAGIPYSIPEDMIREQWWKFMMNVGINQVSAVLRAPYGVFHNISEARKLMEMASREVLVLAAKEGINLNEEDIVKCFKVLSTLSPEGKTSMLQDIEAGRKTEVEIFAGTVIELGRRHSIETPVNNILFKMIRTFELAAYM